MKLLTFTVNGEESYGIVTGDAVIDLRKRLPAHRSLRDLLTAGALAEAERHAGADADHAIGDVSVAKPIPVPEKTLCIGVNYVNRNAEYQDDSDLPKYPSINTAKPASVKRTAVWLRQPSWRCPQSRAAKTSQATMERVVL